MKQLGGNAEMNKKFVALGVGLTAVVALSACSLEEEAEVTKTPVEEVAVDHTSHEEAMQHSSDGSIPEGLQVAENPRFAVNDLAYLTTNHMGYGGLTQVTITGAYDTYAYAVTYTPADGVEVADHKWIVNEEIKDFTSTPFNVGDEVSIEADHIKGMLGTVGTVTQVEKTTVYMVSYQDSTGNEVENHKWVIDLELDPVYEESHLTDEEIEAQTEGVAEGLPVGTTEDTE